jgi:hypothetical protein
VGAFSFSLYAWRQRIRQDQRDLFLKVHELLVSAEHQRGRRILYRRINSVGDARTLLRGSPEEYDLANMALAALDTAALYVERGHVSEDPFMGEWGTRRLLGPPLNRPARGDPGLQGSDLLIRREPCHAVCSSGRHLILLSRTPVRLGITLSRP